MTKNSFESNQNHYYQESCAIATMTAQCAPYMGALKIFGTPYANGYFSQKKLWAFVLIHHMNMRTKFKIRSFTRS